MRVLEIGIGAVGVGLASAVANTTGSLDLVARPETAAALQTRGLHRSGILGEVHIPPERFNVYTNVWELPFRAYDVVLVTTKAYDAHGVAALLSDRPCLLSPGTPIVLFCNGIGAAEMFAARFAPEQIYCARVVTGFELLDRTSVRVTAHAAPIAIGNPFTGESQTVATLCSTLTKGGIPSEPCSEIVPELWAKMIFNCAVNALGALTGLPIGELAAQADLRHRMEQIIDEVFRVMHLAGYHTHWGTASDYLRLLYGRLIPATASHRTSMYHDLRAGKRTEIDFLNGAIANMGRRLGIRTPVNSAVTKAVKNLEASPRQVRESLPPCDTGSRPLPGFIQRFFLPPSSRLL